MVSLVAKLVSIPELNKINKVTSVVACNICVGATMDFSIVEHLSGFQGIPEDVCLVF